MKQMLVVRIERCLGCKTCELACAVEHSASRELEKAARETPAPQSRVHVMQGSGFAAPLQCRQCEDASCVAACPTGALLRHGQEEPVLLDRDRCIGCMWCVEACPFGVIAMDNGNGAVVKCDQCFERAQRGEPPVCVEACPTNALECQRLDAVVAEKRDAYLVRIERAAQEAAL
jgi:carbon-monoxide dehydrogenase iron sulfur subunit